MHIYYRAKSSISATSCVVPIWKSQSIVCHSKITIYYIYIYIFILIHNIYAYYILHIIYIYIYIFICIKYKCISEVPEKVKKPLPEKICYIKFCNNAVELINLSAVLHNENLEAAAQKVSSKLVTRNIIYQLPNCITPKIFNFNNGVSNFDVR